MNHHFTQMLQKPQSEVTSFKMKKNDLDTRKNAIKKWVGKQVRIKLMDERVFIGFFVCIDNDCNIIISDSKEFHPKNKQKLIDREDVSEVSRNIGLAMIRGKDIFSFWVSIKRKNHK